MWRYLLILPRARRWLSQTIATHEDQAIAIPLTLRDRFARSFSAPILDATRVVLVDHVPQPPLRKWGFDEHHGLVGDAAGITLREFIFVQRGHENDASLLFHELVHLVQWRTLGVNRFLALYGLQLREHGYRHSPLEEMAYDLQSEFDAGDAMHHVEAVVQRRTQEVLANFRRRSMTHRAVFAIVR